MKRAAAILISIALLAWLVASGQWRGVGPRLLALPPGLTLLAVGGFAVSYLLRAARMHDEFRDAAGPHFWAMTRITLAHNAANNVMPFRSGEIALPLLLQREFGVPMGRAVMSLLWLRLQDAFVVLLLAAWTLPHLSLPLRAAWSLAVLVAAWAVPAWARSHPAIAPEQTGWRAKFAKLRVALAHSTRGAWRSWGWTVANWTVKLSAQSVLLAALLDVSARRASAGVLGGELAAILPVQGVAGFGTYEAGVASALLPHGIALTAGLQTALVLHLVIIASAVVAGAAGFALLPAGPASLAVQEKHS